MSRVIFDELQKLNARQRESADDGGAFTLRLPRRRFSTAIERHSHLIHLYLMLELGYGLPDLDALLLRSSRGLNPHRLRLRKEVVSGEFGYNSPDGVGRIDLLTSDRLAWRRTHHRVCVASVDSSDCFPCKEPQQLDDIAQFLF